MVLVISCIGSVLQDVCAMHYNMYYINRLITIKVRLVNQQCITYMSCGRARTNDHRTGSQDPYPIAPHK